MDGVSESFSDLLGQHRRRHGLSRNHLAHLVHVDPSYLCRIEHDERDPPRSHIVDAIARTLQLTSQQWDAFRLSAGYSPRVVNGSGWSPALHLTAQVLNDYRLSPEDRAKFEAMIQTIAEHWIPIKEA